MISIVITVFLNRDIYDIVEIVKLYFLILIITLIITTLILYFNDFNYDSYENKFIYFSIFIIVLVGVYKFINFILKKGIYHPQSFLALLIAVCGTFIAINFYSASYKLSKLPY